MARIKICDAVKSGKILISDGAWGTFLQKKGLKPGQCPELWSVERFEEVADIAKCYIASGADMVKTNSFGASGIKLEFYGLADRASEINEAAARASRLAAGEDAWVIGSIGPTGKMLLMGDVTEQQLYDSFREQAAALEKGGADAVCIETMSDTEEACLAVKAARENTNLEIICTFTFDRTARGDYRTMMGVTPEKALAAIKEAGADIAGTNCGNGMERMIEIVTRMRNEDKDIPLLVHANAGLPQRIDGKEIFPDTPQDMAALAPRLAKAGANIIGGCCGTTPEHIRSIKQALAEYEA